MVKQNQKTIIGRGWAFPPSFSREGKGSKMVDDIEDIHQSLTILLGTRRGERVMQPEYGCDLHKYVFEPLDDSLCYYLQNLIRIAIVKYEQRIEMLSIDFETTPEAALITYSLIYRIRNSSQEGNFVFPFYLEGGSK